MMKASPDLLYALSEKLHEIAENTADLETKSELNELSEAMIDSADQLTDQILRLERVWGGESE
jgi:hypothetical protein